jgi:trans-2,3-dihydro-3-hydroxyanthranilate isomerase
MSRHRFHLVNVFASSTLSGNALCVFEDGSVLTDEQMQALALQFNLSETTFLFPSTVATARVRIFTPSFEMPFAGHPTLGSAHVVRMLRPDAGDAVTLEMQAGTIPVAAAGDVWTLQARPPRVRPAEATRPEIAAMLGLQESDLGADMMWVDTGSEQLVVPLRSPEAVARCRVDAALLAKHGSNARRDGLAYVWAREHDAALVARFFFLKNGSLVEDPGTGSACANLGGWLVATGAPLPTTLCIRQGEHTGRACHLGLRVDAEKRIYVTGNVIAIATGEVTL